MNFLSPATIRTQTSRILFVNNSESYDDYSNMRICAESIKSGARNIWEREGEREMERLIEDDRNKWLHLITTELIKIHFIATFKIFART